MHVVAVWSAFIGAWLLFTGPLHQAALELAEEQRAIGRQRLGQFDQAVARARGESAPSPWWWLLPPVGYLKNRRHQRRQQRDLFRELGTETTEQLVRYKSVGLGWVIVAAGALFIAVKETAELAEYYEAPWWAWLLTVAVMTVSGAAFTAVSARRRRDILSYIPERLPPESAGPPAGTAVLRHPDEHRAQGSAHDNADNGSRGLPDDSPERSGTPGAEPRL